MALAEHLDSEDWPLHMQSPPGSLLVESTLLTVLESRKRKRQSCLVVNLILGFHTMTNLILGFHTMTKDEGKAYLERYRLVNEFTAEESRRMSPEEKLRLTTIMFDAARQLGWQEKLREGEEEVWERWQVLREKMGCLKTQ